VQWQTVSLAHLRPFCAPRHGDCRLKITYAVIDLTTVELIGGDDGLGDFWNRWFDCASCVTDDPPRTTCHHLFANEMRKSKMMTVCVRDYDELLRDHVDETWEFMEMTGRACFERARQCENLTQSQHCLSGKPHPKAIMDAAVPGVPYVPPVGEGQGQPMVPPTACGIVDPGSWPNATTRPGEVSVPITQE
jgi:hypothetical protein